MGPVGDNYPKMQVVLPLTVLLCLGPAFVFLKSLNEEQDVPKIATRPPWITCQSDADCPDPFLCNTYQDRCTECMDDSDCLDWPVGDILDPPTCIYGDHCCTQQYC